MNRKKLFGAALALLFIVLAPLTATASTATLYGPKLAPNGVGQDALYRSSEWNGAEPTWYGSTDWWIVSAPADPSPDLKRRSEFKVGTSWEAARYTGPGKKMQWKGWLKPVLGAAKNDGRSWHSLVQLHGPDAGTGAWTFSQVAIRVEMGNWVLWGDDGSNVAAWKQTIMPYTDDYATYAMITYRAEAAPLLSQVCVTLNPAASSAGDPPPVSACHWAESWDSQWVDWQAGLYRGSGSTPFEQGGIQPTYEQHVFVKEPIVTVY